MAARRQGEARPPLRLEGDALFAIAALWEEGAGGAEAALLTTEANGIVRPLHDRMPAILPPEAWAEWLGAASPLAKLAALLRPWPEEGMRVLAVGKAVGSPRNEGPACIEPAGPMQRSLF